jgi:hypothetical protein
MFAANQNGLLERERGMENQWKSLCCECPWQKGGEAHRTVPNESSNKSHLIGINGL